MAQQTPAEAIQRYLQDAIAAEQNFETQLRAFAAESEYPEVKQVFAQHAEETKGQHERLTARLEALGGKPSGMKSFLAHLFGLTPMAAQLGHDASERATQDLVMAFAVENSEVAMYESMATAAAACGDTETEQLARAIQQEERAAAEKVWGLVATVARRSFEKVTGSGAATRQAA